MSDTKEEVDSLRRELYGIQEMLAQVLWEVAEPVEVTKKSLKAGLPKGAEIRIDDTPDAFVFSLVVPDES